MGRIASLRILALHLDAEDPALHDLIGEPVSKDWIVDNEGRHRGINEEGFFDLLRHAARYRGDEKIAFAASVSYHDVMGRLTVEERRRLDLYGYMGMLLEGDLSSLSPEDDEALVIGVNLLGFNPRDSHIDQILAASTDVFGSRDDVNRSGNALVLMVHSSRGIVTPAKNGMPRGLKRFVDREDRRIEVLVFDYEKRVCYYLDKSSPEADVLRVPIHGDAVFKALNVGEKNLERELVFRTNMHIGHFALKSCHVRTHYDVREFVRKDFARESVYQRLAATFDDMDKGFHLSRCIIVHGIHELTLYQLASDFARSGGAASVIAGSEMESERSIASIKDSECFIILTDIVNTGQTIGAYACNLRAKLKGRIAEMRLLAIARMRNTPHEYRSDGCTDIIESVVTINRGYYPIDQCPLCGVLQPSSNDGRPITTPEMFDHTDRQMTPFDFWEMVGERDCLKLERNPGSAGCSLWVSTTESNSGKSGLVVRYSRWLREFLRERLHAIGIEQGSVDSIVTVDEKSGGDFSRLVASVLDISERSIMTLSRNELDGTEGVGDALKRARVLLVDDGVNTGLTFRALARRCSEAKIVAGIVFDSQLNEREVGYLEEDCGIERGRFACLYGWKTGGEKAVEQLGRMIKNWGRPGYEYDPVGAIANYCMCGQKSLDAVFDVNPQLYDRVFLSNAHLPGGKKVVLVRCLSDDSDISHYCGQEVRRKYRELYDVAETIKKELQERSSNGNFGNSKKAISAAKGIQGNPETADTDGIVSVELEAEMEKRLNDRTVPIYATAQTGKPVLGTGFLFNMHNRQTGDSNIVVVSCNHVYEQSKNKSLFALYNGKYYEMQVMLKRDEYSAIDISVFEFKNGPEECKFFSDAGERAFRRGEEYTSFFYTKKRSRRGGTHRLLFQSNDRGQSGESEFSADYSGAGEWIIGEGSSGSPVVDGSGALVGMITTCDDVENNRQKIGVIHVRHLLKLLKDYQKGCGQ